ITAGRLVIGDATAGDITVSNTITLLNSYVYGITISGGGFIEFDALLDAGSSPIHLHPSGPSATSAARMKVDGIEMACTKLSFGSDLAISITNATTYDQLTVGGVVDLT